MASPPPAARARLASATTPSREPAAPVKKSIVQEAPGSSTNGTRSAAIASSTGPARPSSGRPCSIAAGSATLRPRPMKRVRSVSNEIATSLPCSTAVWKSQASLSFGVLGRRVASTAPRPASNSVSTNSLLNAGCAESVAGGDSTISAWLVTQRLRRVAERLTTCSRRSSMSASAQTATSRRVSIP